MLNHLKIGCIAVLISFVLSCKEKDMPVQHDIVAQVGEDVLSRSQLSKMLPEDVYNTKDSGEIASEAIQNWIKQQLLVAEAEKELIGLNDEIEDQLQTYREQLIIHLYKQQKFNELESSTIDSIEISSYYQNNQKLFVLDEPIVQVNYIIFPEELNLPNSFLRNLNSNNEKRQLENEDFIFNYAKKYDNFNNDWVYFDNIARLAQLELDNTTRYINRNEYLDFTADNNRHIIVIQNAIFPGEVAPLEFVEEKISSLIINQRKLDFLREIKDSLYNDALKYNKFRLSN